MTRLLIALLLVVSLAACNRKNESDQPTGTIATPAEAPATADLGAPATSATSGMAAESGTATGPIGTGTDTGAVGTGGAAMGNSGMTPSGQSDATLEADLRQCDTMTGTEQATCRTEAQARYEQRAASGNMEEGDKVPSSSP